MQIFTKMANRWAERVCEGDECSEFRAALEQTDVEVTSAHDSYLINCASPDDLLRQRSIDSLEWELRRCDALDLDYLVSHPGNFMDDRSSGIARNAEAIGIAMERANPKVTLLLELTAGSGTVLGSTFEEMTALLDRIPPPWREKVATPPELVNTTAQPQAMASSAGSPSPSASEGKTKMSHRR